MNEKLLTVSQAAKYLKIGKDKMYLLIKNGKIKAIDLWGLKIKVEDLDKFINDYAGYTFDRDNNNNLIINDTLSFQNWQYLN